MKDFKYMMMVLCALWPLCGCGGGNGGDAGRKDDVLDVKVMKVEKVSGRQVRSYVGEARASRSAVLAAPYPGTLESVTVGKGDRVASGQVLARVVSEGVNSGYEMAMAVLRQAEDGYERVMKVYHVGGVPEVKVVEVETEVAKARAAVAAAKDALEACIVKAPFAGTVSEVYQHQGTQVVSGLPLMRVVDERSVEIDFPVPESELADMRIGEKAFVDIPALSLSDVQASVVSKGVEADMLAHTYDCVLSPDRPVPGLMPGMVCKVHLEGDLQSGFAVPADLVQTDRRGRYVWVVDDGIVEKTYIKTGSFYGKGVLVDEGLNEGDQVISEGFRKVSVGMKVNVVK